QIAHHYPEGSIGENFFHFMGEVEAVFGMWAAVFVLFIAGIQGPGASVEYLESLNFTEPAFVFVIMAMAATRPVLKFSEKCIQYASFIFPFPRKMAFFCSALI